MVGSVERLSIYVGITFMVQYHCMTAVRLKNCTIACGIKEMSMDSKQKKNYTIASLDVISTAMEMVIKYPDQSVGIINHMKKRLDEILFEYMEVDA
tara:strand:- start:126 stop:413 length:288 start_codon:yes stop_codon:yes gene_type:complete